jgi:hypothetical protein
MKKAAPVPCKTGAASGFKVTKKVRNTTKDKKVVFSWRDPATKKRVVCAIEVSPMLSSASKDGVYFKVALRDRVWVENVTIDGKQYWPAK